MCGETYSYQIVNWTWKSWWYVKADTTLAIENVWMINQKRGSVGKGTPYANLETLIPLLGPIGRWKNQPYKADL